MSAAARVAARLKTVTVDTPAGPLTVRPPRGGDGPGLHALVQAVLAEGRFFLSHPEEQPLDAEALIRQLLTEDQRDNSLVRVAVLARRPVGLLTLTGGRLRRLRHVARLEVRVGAEHRGQGVGRALVARGIAEARVHPVLRKLSLAVFADNAAALGLYRSVGFVEEGRRLGEVREDDGTLRDDVLMGLPL